MTSGVKHLRSLGTALQCWKQDACPYVSHIARGHRQTLHNKRLWQCDAINMQCVDTSPSLSWP